MTDERPRGSPSGWRHVRAGRRRSGFGGSLATLLAAPVFCLAAATTAARADVALPPDVLAALKNAKVPLDAVSIVVEDLSNPAGRLMLNADVPRNPASVTKLVTTYAALDLLGPAWSWQTPVWLQGSVHDGVLDGSVYIKGSGDPTLVIERLWLLLRQLQQRDVREIHGDIVLDHGAFEGPDVSPAEFDNDPARPYNVRPDALMLNFKTVTLSLAPGAVDAAGKPAATVTADLSLAGVRVDATVPVTGGACDDWRAALKPRFDDPSRIAFAGALPASCGVVVWPIAYADPAGYDARLVADLWREMGGRLGGSVRDGRAPAGPPSFEFASPPLAQVVRDINKFSNNVMAQQLFLTLGLVGRGAGTPEAAREAVRGWMRERLGPATPEPVIDNGSGLSRDTRLGAQWLSRLLKQAFSSAVMSELMSSLPVNGIDGTARRSRATLGRAHLKTGSLRDVASVAGFVLSDSGRRYVLVAIVNHPNANAARPALDALVQWAIQDGALPR